MKSFKSSQIQGMSAGEIHQELASLKANLYNFSKQAALRQLKDYKSIMATRHNIARLNQALALRAKEGKA
jgi:ribosomal protein L29